MVCGGEKTRPKALMPPWFCSTQASSEWYRVSKLLQEFQVFTYHTSCTSRTTPLLLHLSPCNFISSFNEISCLIVCTCILFCTCVGYLRVYFFSKRRENFWSVIIFNLKADKQPVWSYFARAKSKQQATLWNCVALCKWTSAIATLQPIWFCENHWHAVSTCKWLLRVAIVRDHRVKISPVMSDCCDLIF